MKIIPLTDTQYQNDQGEIYPWFTKPCLEWLNTVDLSDKNIFEWGSGSSTNWFLKRCKSIHSVEASAQWYSTFNYLDKSCVELRECNEGNQEDPADKYIQVQTKKKYHVFIVDGILRNECLLVAIAHLSKNNGGIIIADNWQQESVWISDAAAKLMSPFKTTLFVEPSRAHEQNPWKTAIFEIPKAN